MLMMGRAHLKRLFFLLICTITMQSPLLAQIPPLPIIDPTVISIDPSTADPNTQPIQPNTQPTTNPTPEGETETKTELELEKEKLKKEEENIDILAKSRQSKLPEAKIWGQNFFRDQSISLFTRTRDMRALPSYKLEENDELNINVWGVADFSRVVRVGNDGYVDLSIPTLKIPRLYLKGMKFGDAQKAIFERLANHMNMNGCWIDIQLNYSRNITVNITGEVFNPGSFNIPAINTAFNALVASNGPNQNGSVRNIKVVSGTQATRVLDIYKFTMNPKIADDFFLSNNDYIYVPIAGRVVNIKGSVKRPYFYELIDGEDLKELIQYAGGLEADAYYRNVQVKRYENNEEMIIDINLGDLIKDSISDFKLINGDIVTISPIKEAYSNFVTISGAVKLAGEYELKPNMRIKDVLVQSGIMLSSMMERIYVKRIKPDFSVQYININADSIINFPESESNIYLRVLDDIEVKFKSEFVDEYNIKMEGAIRKPGQYRHSDSLSLADLIYLSNGIKNEAALSYVEISRLIQNKDGSTSTQLFQFPIREDLQVRAADDFLMKPYDQVFVRQSKAFELPQNIKIDGEVNFPGSYTISGKKERIHDLIRRSGGLTSIAFAEGAKLFRKGDGYVLLDLQEVLKDSNSVYNYLLKEGDVITVPKIKDLVSIAGRVNHPYIKEQSEIAELELKIKLMKALTEVEREEILAKEKIVQMKNPLRINVPFHKLKRANYYLKEYAAGIDRFNGGRDRLVYVKYPDGSVKRAKAFLFFKLYPKVEKGSMVYVDTKTKNFKPKNENKKPIDWTNIIRSTFSILTSGLTIYALINAATR